MSGAAPSGRKRSAREGGLKGQTSLANFLRPPAHVNALPSDVVAGHGGRQDPGTVAGPPAASPPRGGGNVGTREALGSVGLGPAGRIAVSASPTRDGLPLGHAEQPTDRRPPLALMTLSPLERDPTGTRSASTAAAMQELPVPNSPLGELSFGGLAKPGVFWKTSPTSLKLRREMSSRIRATAATQAASTEEGSRGGPSPPNADVEVDATGPTPSKRSGLKRFLSLDNLFAGKPESAGAKRPKRQHWANQSPEEAPSDGGAGASKLSDIISRAQKLLTSTPKRASVPTSPVRSAKKTTRSPFERSASTSWIPDIRSSSAAKGISPDKKQAAPEEFDFDFDIDLANMDLEAELAEDIEKLPTRKTFKFRRFLVLESHGAGEFRNSDIILRVFDETESQEATVVLRESWVSSPVGIGDFINVVGDPEPSYDSKVLKFVVNDSKNFLILHPDVLISSTQIAEVVNCMRKAVIDDRIKRAGDSNVAALFGTMMHEIIQTSLRAADYSDDFLSRETDRVVADKIEQLYFLGQSEDAATAHLAQLTQSYKEWAGTYLTDFPRPPIVKPAQTWKSKHTEAFSIWKVLDIEENIWSPMFGIKGKIDASVCIRVTKAPKLLADTFVAPLEIKAGGASNQASHLAQTMMYTLLMTDRYGFDVDSGVLYYAKSGDTTRVAKARNELRSIIMGRNEMASWLQSKKLPPMLQDVRKCQRCFAIDACTVYHKALEKGTDASSGLGLIFQDKTKDMTPLHDSFFKTWEQLINLEEGDALRYRREIWNLNSAERAKFGRCLPNMRLVGGETDRGKIVGAVSRYRCVFEVGSGASQASGSQQNLLQSQFVVGDPVVVSTEAGQYALGLGFVIEISTRRITLALDHPLTGNRGRAEHFSALDNQDIEGIAAFENVEGGTGKKLAGNAGGAEPVMYRIDKDEMQGAMGTLRNNLVQLFVSNGDHKRRELVVDLRAPRFLPNVDLDDMAPRELLDELNPDQREALKKVTSAVDYALILGMPGTGKTTTIATIIKALVGKGKSVFLTSHTHSAVDNVLIKLKESGVRFARIGNRDKVHPAVLEHTPNYDGSFRTVGDVREFYESVSVVGATCLSITHGVFTARRFDYCIVDEASQITLPACLGPLRYADTFILVGDHYQLPPVIRNPEAEGLSESLFKRLSEAHPQAMCNLQYQYRMNRDIMSVSNFLIYNHRLRCGTEDVAQGSLHVPRLDRVADLHPLASSCPGSGRRFPSQEGEKGSSCWLEHVLSPKNKVVFLDTDAVPATEARHGDLVQNEVEADLVFQIAEALLACGIEEGSIGVISPYRSQLKLINHRLRRRRGLEINTVDKYQGRDKDCIIISLVRSNAKNNVGDLLRDWRRVNVAVTRARQKLLILGSRSTLGSTALFQDFFSFLSGRDWILDLPPGAPAMHSFVEHASPQRTGATGRPPDKENSSPNVKTPTHTGPSGVVPVVTEDARFEKQREMALSRLHARSRGQPVLKNVFDEIL